MSKVRSITIEFEDAQSLYINPGMIDQMLRAGDALVLLNRATEIAKRLSNLTKGDEE